MDSQGHGDSKGTSNWKLSNGDPDDWSNIAVYDGFKGKKSL